VAGMIFEINCKGNGKLSMGNMKPESNIVGIMSETKLANIAACCVSTCVDIRIPRDSDATV
jgi:hypothetical protein